MAENAFGLSFAPLLANLPQQGQYASPGAGSPQEAIQTLSLRRPTVYGAQAPAAPQLLYGAGSANLSPLQRLLMALQQGGMTPATSAAGGGGGGNGQASMAPGIIFNEPRPPMTPDPNALASTPPPSPAPIFGGGQRGPQTY